MKAKLFSRHDWHTISTFHLLRFFGAGFGDDRMQDVIGRREVLTLTYYYRDLTCYLLQIEMYQDRIQPAIGKLLIENMGKYRCWFTRLARIRTFT